MPPKLDRVWGSVPTLHTERLTLRPFMPSDAPTYNHLIHSEPEVMRWLAGAAPLTLTQTRERFKYFAEQWISHGTGIWAMTERGNDEVIGHCGLLLIPGTDVIEIAYALGIPYWGKGYATEAARATLAWGFESRALPCIVGLSYEANLASRRVLEKIGMRYAGMTDRFYNTPLALYTLEREEYKASSQPR